jgi:hypothetical protein
MAMTDKNQGERSASATLDGLRGHFLEQDTDGLFESGDFLFQFSVIVAPFHLDLIIVVKGCKPLALAIGCLQALFGSPLKILERIVGEFS